MYSAAAAQQMILDNVAISAGYGDYVWADTPPALYRVGPGSAPVLSLPGPIASVSNGTLVVDTGFGAGVTVDLSAATPTAVAFNVGANPTKFAFGSDASVLAADSLGLLYRRQAGATQFQKKGCGAVRSVALSANNIAAIAVSNGQVIVADIASRSIQATIPILASRVSLSEDGTVLAAWGEGKWLQIHSLPDGALLAKVDRGTRVGGQEFKAAFELTGDGESLELLTCLSANPLQCRLEVTDLAGANPAFSFVMPQPSDTPAPTWHFSPDRTALALLAWESTLDTATSTYETTYSTSVYEDGSLYGAALGAPLAWLDDDRLLVMTFSTGQQPADYTGTFVVDRQGSQLAHPALPYLGGSAKALAAGAGVYSPYRNTIYNTTTAAEVWTRKDLAYNTATGAANETRVLYGSLSTIFVFDH